MFLPLQKLIIWLVVISWHIFCFLFSEAISYPSLSGWGGMSTEGYFHIVSSLTFHNQLSRGPVFKLIESKKFWFVSANLFEQPVRERGIERKLHKTTKKSSLFIRCRHLSAPQIFPAKWISFQVVKGYDGIITPCRRCAHQQMALFR